MNRLQLAQQTADRLTNSLKELAKATQQEGSDAAQLIAAGRIFEYANHFASAEACYRQAISTQPGHYEALARLALVQLKLRMNADALQTAGQLVEKAPDFKFATLDGTPTSAASVFGDALKVSGNFQAAVHAYKRALSNQPTDSYSAGCLADLLMRSGQIEEAQHLTDRIADTEDFASVRAMLRLSTNDPDLLPAVLGFRKGITLMSIS